MRNIPEKSFCYSKKCGKLKDRYYYTEYNYDAFLQNMSTVKHGHDSMLMEMERLNMQLKEEQNRVLTLQNELKFGTANNRKLIEVST